MSTHVLHRRASVRTRTFALVVAGALAASMLVVDPAAGSSGIERTGSLALPETVGSPNFGSAVSDATHAYFGYTNDPGLESIVKVAIDGSQRVDITGGFPLNVGNGWASAAERGDFLYFAANSVPGRIYKVAKNDLTIDTMLELSSALAELSIQIDSPRAAHIDSTGAYGYFAGRTPESGTQGRPAVVKVRLSDMKVVGYRVIDIVLGEGWVATGAFDDNHGYLVYDGAADAFTTPRVMKVALDQIVANPNSLLAVTTVDLRQANHLDATDGVLSAAADQTHLYFGSREGRVTKMLKSDMSLVSTISLSEQPGLVSAVIDGTHAYFSGSKFPFGRVVKVDLAADSGKMAEVSATSLCRFELASSAVLAAPGGHLLVGVGGPIGPIGPSVVRVGAGSRAACPDESVTTGGGGGGGDAATEDAPVATAVAAASAANVAGSSSAVLVRGGEVVPVMSSRAAGAGPRGGVVLEAEGLRVTVAAAGGASPQTGVVAPVSGEIVCELCAAFAAGSTIEAWLYSSPQLVAAVQVPDDHQDGDCILLRVPVGAPLTGEPVAAGAHTLQLRMYVQDGLEVLATGVTVGTVAPARVPAGEGPPSRGLLGVFGLLAAAGAAALVRRSRASAVPSVA